MLKLMIVDDEYIVRQGLRRIVPWQDIGISIVGEAENVQEATELARRVLPDIVICDIRLPGGEGFLIIDEIRKIVPWVQFIMITAYSDKEFMLQAIQKGASDYLFKPAGVDDIKNAVARASQKALEWQAQIAKDMKHQRFIMENLDILRGNFLENLIKGLVSEDRALQDAAALKICLQGPFWHLVYFQLDAEHYYEIIQQVSVRLEKFGPVIAGTDMGRSDAVILLNSPVEEPQKEILEKIGDLSLSNIRISSACNKLGEISGLYHEIMAEEAVAGEQEQVLPYLDSFLLEKQEMLFEAVKYHDSMSELSRLFGDFLSEARRRGISGKKIVQECKNMMDTVRILTGLPKKQWEIREDEDPGELFSELCREIQESKRYQLDDISGKALYYIRKKYQEDLTLEQIAAELFMSSSYLSRIIKERTGHGFGHWLNYYRIKEAKEKLKDPSRSIEQVALECGYNSYRIFSENFRKYTGRTATAWRMEKGIFDIKQQ